MLKNYNFLDIEYNDDLLYLSMHDNHQTGTINDNFYSIWADDPSDWKEDGLRSYTKILEVNISDKTIDGLPPKTYKNILNYDNSTLSKNDMYSPYCSSSLFFSLNYEGEFHNYLSTNSAGSNTTQLVEFDHVDTTNNLLIEPELIFEIKWTEDDFGYLYRGYTILENISNSYWGWNLMEMQK